MIGCNERLTEDDEKETTMSGKREKEQGEHRQAVVTRQMEKRSASTAHHTLGRLGDKDSTLPCSVSTDHHTDIITNRPREIKRGGSNKYGDISDDNNPIRSSDKTHDEKSQQ